MVNVGIVGVGFMGLIHYLAYQRAEGIGAGAICTRSEKKRAGDWRGIQGNFGPPGEQMDLKGISAYAELEELLADDSIDVVDLCLPPHLHVEAALKSFAAGKHVFCEKPMSLTPAECDQMVAAAADANKLLFIAHVLPYHAEFAYACRVVRSGEFGKLLGGHFKRVISDPLWIQDFYDPRAVGGPLIDLHVHDAHFIRLLCGMPTYVESQGRMRGEVVEYCNTLFTFDDANLVVSATSGVINQQGRPFTHGFEIHLERATLLFDFAVIGGQAEMLMPLTVLTNAETDNVIQPDLGGGDEISPFVGEIQEVAQCVAAGKTSELLDGGLARDAIVLCEKQTESVVSRTKVAVSA